MNCESRITLRQALVDASRSYGLAVIGYSGRDASIMETLRGHWPALGHSLGASCWLTSAPESVLPAVRELMSQAAAAKSKRGSCNRRISTRASVYSPVVTLPDASEPRFTP